MIFCLNTLQYGDEGEKKVISVYRGILSSVVMDINFVSHGKPREFHF